MKSYDTPGHVRGESLFIDDLALPAGLLHAAVFTSPIPFGKVRGLDGSIAAAMPGVRAVLFAQDIPGENQIGNIIKDEPLLAEDEVHYVGQPLALVIATSPGEARRAASHIAATFEEMTALFDPRQAAAKGSFIAPPRTIARGDVDRAFGECHVVVEGRASTGAEEHLYLETQSAAAIPEERGGIKLLSATQSPTSVQRTAAAVLGLPMNRIEVETARLGGAFGGKEDQATPWAALCALAAFKLKRPVKMVLTRSEDIRWTGKRHPYELDYKLGLSKEGRIIAYEATFYQNSGAAADLSTAVLERSLLHAASSYVIPNIRVTGLMCKTHLPPFTAFRGFGAPQAAFCMEAALDHGARALGMPRRAVQWQNLLRTGDAFPCGALAENAAAVRSFEEARAEYRLDDMEKAVERFNLEHRFEKQGLSVMPICFGISFTNTFLNQAGALVHLYTDGTVLLSTGAVEMGQGVNAKLIAVAKTSLGISEDLISIGHTNTSRTANTSPTAASSAADLNGMAVKKACDALRQRLICVAADILHIEENRLSIVDGMVVQADGTKPLSWKALIAEAYMKRVNLTAQAHFAVPGIYYDKQREQGRPFAYHVFGTAITKATLDVLRGEYRIDEVKIIHDAGRSLNKTIDLGQVEGGLVQGLGWMTMEEIVYSEGRLLTDSLSTYKVPDLPSAPRVEVRFLEDADNPAAVMQSKAIGEPPLLYGIGAFFAVLDAMRAHAPTTTFSYDAPLTNERVFSALFLGRKS